MDRLHAEQVFHDHQALHRAPTFGADPATFIFDDNTYLDHETWIRPAFAKLGDVHGLRVLDFGCGHGMASVVLARNGASVTAFDLSLGYLAEARRRAAANGVSIDIVQADGERLPFADASFDRIWGNAILHHLDLDRTGAELRRVLRPGGRAVFCEPWGGNPLLNFARAQIPYPGKRRTADERPLDPRSLAVLRPTFPHFRMHGFQLFSMLRRVVPAGRMIGALQRWDERVLTWFPGLQQFCRYVVLTLPR